jgi:hypothetical protein
MKPYIARVDVTHLSDDDLADYLASCHAAVMPEPTRVTESRRIHAEIERRELLRGYLVRQR